MEIENNIEPIIEEPVSIPTLSLLLKTRKLLQNISNLTFSYSVLNKQHPINEMKTQEEANEIIENYNQIIEEISNTINNFYKY